MRETGRGDQAVNVAKPLSARFYFTRALAPRGDDSIVDREQALAESICVAAPHLRLKLGAAR